MNEQTTTAQPVSLASLMTPSKTVTIDYPDMEGFSVQLTYLSPETLGVVNQPLGHVSGSKSV